MEKFHFFKPTVKNITDMQNLVLSEVANGNILDRSSSEMATTIRSYTVVYHDDLLVGFAALHIHTTQLAEIRSLVVHSGYRGQGIGSELILKSMSEAKQLDLEKVLVLTYQQQLFTKYGFNVIEKESIPETKIWLDCVKCKHFPICDEIALIKEI
ncbi:MAG TPA: N-acetyltransferase [Flavobacteriia bacterium]|jgi:amino-acid N-acetyltransferase|nr:N-acetyltransferase [Flavobacteriia bacterium]